MTQILVKDVFWDALFGTQFRIGNFWNSLEKTEIYLKNGQKFVEVHLGQARELKFCMNMLC
jgi:hypothetical protein